MFSLISLAPRRGEASRCGGVQRQEKIILHFATRGGKIAPRGKMGSQPGYRLVLSDLARVEASGLEYDHRS
jgi:hypothetical protein